MTSFLILLKTSFSSEDFKEFLLTFDNSYWHNKPSGSYGVISVDNAVIYLDYYTDGFSQYYFDESNENDIAKLNSLVEKLEGYAKTCICVHVGHENGSGKLALLFADKLIEKWGGIIDWEESGTSPEILKTD